MQKLLSLPPNLIHCFHELEGVNRTDWFCTSDPVGSKLGSGGGTTWLLQACHQEFAPQVPFSDWIGREKRILLHAGRRNIEGQEFLVGALHHLKTLYCRHKHSTF